MFTKVNNAKHVAWLVACWNRIQITVVCLGNLELIGSVKNDHFPSGYFIKQNVELT